LQGVRDHIPSKQGLRVALCGIIIIIITEAIDPVLPKQGLRGSPCGIIILLS
jgi:hypothetical protein